MQAVAGRYNVKVQMPGGHVGWGSWEVGPGTPYPDLESVLSYYRGTQVIPLEVKTGEYPWDPPPSKEQKDYAAVATQVVSTGDLSAGNLSKISQLQAPGVTPTATPNASPNGTLINAMTGQPSGLAGQSNPLAQALQSSAAASTPGTASVTSSPVATLKNAAGNEIKITLDGSGATSQRLSELVQQGYAIQSTTGNPDFQAQTPPSPALSPVTQAVGINTGSPNGGTATLSPQSQTLTSALQGEVVNSQNQPVDPGRNNPGDYTVAVKTSDGIFNHVGLTEALNQQLSSGGQIQVNGRWVTPEQFQGGWIVPQANGQWTTLDPLFGRPMTTEQAQALNAAGRPAVGPGTIGGSTGNTGGTGTGTGYGAPGGAGTTTGAGAGWMGDPNATAPAMSSDLQQALKELMQEARNQGVRGQQALTGLVDDYKNYLGFARSAAEQTFNRRDQLTDALLGKVTPAIESAIGTMNQSTGLSPEAMAALRGQAIEGTQRDYQGQVQELKSQLGARGAYGGGSTPGDFNAILGGYAPLMQNRDAQRSGLLANTILADEQRKFDTLNLNRNTAMSALGTGAGLTSALAGAYNPASMFSANEGALSGLLNTVNAGTGAGFQGLNTAGNLANVLQEMQPGSFRNTLLAALLGTGVSALPNLLPNIFGTANNVLARTLPQQNPTSNSRPNPFPTNPNPGTPPFNPGY